MEPQSTHPNQAETIRRANPKPAAPKVDPVRQEGGAPVEAPARGGVRFARFFSTAGVDPFDTVEWEVRDAVITNEKGETVFEQRGVEIPKSWSQTATNVVVSKYFRGQLETPQRESSVRQLIGRVVDTITAWGRRGGYFAAPAPEKAGEAGNPATIEKPENLEDPASVFRAELTHILLHQYAC